MQDSNEHTEVLRNIPLIPLRDLVVFPATLVPFIVGRSSSIQALEKAAEKDKMIFLAAQMDASVDNPTPKDIYSVGVTAKIIRTIKSDDRNMKVIVEGKSRARIVEYLSTYPYYQILAKVVKEVEDHLPESKELLKRVLALFEDYLKLNQNTNLDSIIPALRENTPERISDIVASHVYMPLEEKQNLLETVNSFERLRRLNYVLENEILKIHTAYQKDPNRAARRRTTFKDGQPGQKGFPPGAPGGRKEDQPNEIEELRQKVAKAKMPGDAQEKAYKEIERLESMPPMSAEATVSRNYLDWLISLPWVKKSREKRELKEAERILNEDHHGLDKVKERILGYLSIRQLVKNPRGVILGFIGPPGVGKSSLGKSIARATGRKFVRLSLGGVRDEAEIRGHRRTYIGAYPGRIIQMIKRGGTKNPVFLLDEVDKMSMDFRGDPASALMEVLDPEQNSTFLDHYIDTDFDLSQVMFIVTANQSDPIPKPLIDRMEIIYMRNAKKYIATGKTPIPCKVNRASAFVDPQGNFRQVTEAVGGRYNFLRLGEGTALNVLDVVHDHAAAQVSHVVVLLESLLGRDLAIGEKAVVDRALLDLYHRRQVRTDHFVPRARSNGFDYDPSTNTVLFFGSVPAVGSPFEVCQRAPLALTILNLKTSVIFRRA
ncbi:MAG: AAA family ATPase [Candidatus Aminicenantes bacterium]|nr:AAA family ATPase [Candidatus Aminicenantes bacterium]